MSEKKTQFKSSWWIRRASYLVIGVVGLIAAGFGLIDEGQLDALTASPLLATVVGFIAAAFTHQGSDSTVTADDVAKAAHASAQVDVTRQVQSAIDAAISALPTADPGKIGQAVVSAIRAEEKGEHDTATGAAANTEAITNYVYGR
ncbi:putative secreted protein [Corynebacterium variabile DSM 44702]|uniref:Putative secreted protein n=1 Tax=Corynebacterium variabile (strain DSM 44702 / CIP 107183 / JCM 12073 / NCIMB 30131) TaxID=858619 RepID=G0HC69_CORVD|nr:hypothetical protein [Corynebacterium variabile]AEK36231.1 putative secreted protein [Corynebacterium variabile DSM 44702]